MLRQIQLAAMEAALKKLDEQEGKYSTELESALQQYRELEAQAAEFDAEELTNARLELRAVWIAPPFPESKLLMIHSTAPLQ